MKEKILALLDGVLHPETGQGLAKSGFVEHIEASAEGIVVTLRFAKSRDPFATKLSQQARRVLAAAWPELGERIEIRIAEHEARQPEMKSLTGGIGRIVAIASGKGGVGKSTVTANLAVALRDHGLRVGILDADIYGPSQPRMFGVEGYTPEAERIDGMDCLIPAESQGIKLMSIGFFIKPDDALMWRGTMACSALKQLIHQTKWGELDFLLIDLPPGTGDIHLSILSELKLTASVIVSTPQQIAVADVRRGVEMFRHPQVNVPVAGIVENMAWFTPAELPDARYYLFGRGGARQYAEEHGIELLGEIPIIQSIMEGAEGGMPASSIDPRVAKYYAGVAEKLLITPVRKEE